MKKKGGGEGDRGWLPTEHTDYTEEKKGVSNFGCCGFWPGTANATPALAAGRKIRQGERGACSVTVGMNSPDPLNSLLASWRHEPAPAADFNAGVWSRIRAGEAARPLAPIVRFPWALPLAASVAVLLSIAEGTGWALALNEAQSADRMASAYVRSIDPLQMSAQHHKHTPVSS